MFERKKLMNRIKRLNKNDLNLILKMNNDFREGFVDKNEALEFFEDNNNFFYVCLFNGEIIGFAYGYVLKRLNSKPMAYIHEVGVLDKFKRQGIASDILKHIKNELFNIGIIKIFLITQKNNIAACRLYDKMDGEIMGDLEYGPCDISYVFKKMNESTDSD